MLTRLPFHNSWGTLTPQEKADNEAYMGLQQADRERKEALCADAAFMAALQALELQEGLQAGDLLYMVGTQHGQPPGPYEYADTPDKCLQFHFEMHPRKVNKAAERAQRSLLRDAEREAKHQARAAFLIEYEQWKEACRLRSERHAEARRTLEQEISAARERYRLATADPAPAAPVKPL